MNFTKREFLKYSSALAAGAFLPMHNFAEAVALAQRIRLQAGVTYYVATTGNDATGDGSSANPWRTLQRGYDFICDDLDLAGSAVLLKVRPGTYSAGISSAKGALGQGENIKLLVQGDITQPGNCVINSAGDCFRFGAGAGGGPKVFIEGFTLSASGGCAISAYGGGTGVGFDACIFLACLAAHLKCAHGGELGAERGAGGGYTVAGGAGFHCMAETGGRYTSDGTVVNWQNSPSFSVCVYYSANGQMNLGGMTHLNGQFVSGMKFSAQALGTILTGAGINSLPGSSPGTVYTGGLYT